jgi:hypothetical protein
MRYMTMDDSEEDDRERKRRERPKRGPKPKRCVVCKGNLESDGYGEYVHAETGFYLAYEREAYHVAVAR